MSPKTRKRLFVGIGGVVAIAGLLFHYQERDSYRCQSCWAKKVVTQWYLGLWGAFSVPVTPKWERVSETRFQHDFLSSDHTHAWMFAQGSPYHFFGTISGGCAIGGGRRVNALAKMYESSSEFRAFISRGLGDGMLTQSNIIAMMSCPWLAKPSPTQKEAEALLEKFFGR